MPAAIETSASGATNQPARERRRELRSGWGSLAGTDCGGVRRAGSIDGRLDSVEDAASAAGEWSIVPFSER